MNRTYWAIIIGIIIVAATVLIFFWALTPRESEDVPETLFDDASEGVVAPTSGEVPAPSETGRLAFLEHHADLYDVTGGRTILGLSTGGRATGIANYKYSDGEYVLSATFPNLPIPPSGTYYEGWIVRQSPLSMISTGKVELIDGTYTNVFESETDFSDHAQYVLTVEPDDGDPAPADRILEGIFD